MNLNTSESGPIQPRSFIGAAVGVMSAVTKLYGMYSEHYKDKRTEDVLNAIQSEIKQIRLEMVSVLAKLDALPEEFGAIVEQVVKDSYLLDKYINFDSLLDLYSLNRKHESASFKPSELHRELAYNLNAICVCEYRLSYMIDFVRCCEIAMLICGRDMKPYVELVVKKKLSLIEPLFTKIKAEAISDRSELLGLFHNGDYIDDYELDDNLLNITNINYSVLPNKQEKHEETRQIPHYHWEMKDDDVGLEGDGTIHGHPHPKKPIYIKVFDGYTTETVTVTNQANVTYNRQKNDHVIKIEKSKLKIKESALRLADINVVINYLQHYVSEIVLEDY
ncbi:hypothetical protein [Vibrio vulnificus]|uniref:hypothetical protein n=1 Tax=Vibrio vulnificus TaxID=672 RepID=UPI003EDA5701